jgi:chromatin structure-remodeling complex subunit SFH1
MNNIRQWSPSVTPPPGNRTNPARKTRTTKGSSLAPTPTVQHTPLPPIPAPPVTSTSLSQPPAMAPQDILKAPLPTTPQALQTTYPSRLRTGATLLMQPIFASTSSTAVATRTSRRGGVVNYTDPGSGDEFPDAGALDSDDSDFMTGGNTRTTTRSARLSSKAPAGAGVFSAGGSATFIQTAQVGGTNQLHKNSLDRSYLGMVPPERFLTSKPVSQTQLHYQYVMSFLLAICYYAQIQMRI